MESYIEYLHPGGLAAQFFGEIRRGFRKVFSLHEAPPMVIYGPGGIGKSTLLAKFILEHAEAAQQKKEGEVFSWIYLDFDRPVVMAEGPASLLFEAVYQLETQFEDLRESGSKLPAKWQQELSEREVKHDEKSAAATLSVSEATATTIIQGEQGGANPFERYGIVPGPALATVFFQYRGPEADDRGVRFSIDTV